MQRAASQAAAPPSICRGPVPTLLCPLSWQPCQALPGACLCLCQGTWDAGAPDSLSKALLSSHPRARCLCDGSVAPGGSPRSSSVRAVLPDPIPRPKTALWFDRSELRCDPGHRLLLHVSPQRWASGRRWVVFAAWLGLARLGSPPAPRSWRRSVAHVEREGCRAGSLWRREFVGSDPCGFSPGRSFPVAQQVGTPALSAEGRWGCSGHPRAELWGWEAAERSCSRFMGWSGSALIWGRTASVCVQEVPWAPC